MNEIATVFESHRMRLFSIAYRMVGTRCDADDIVQDAYLRWHQAPIQEIRSPIAFLITITTRLCLDHLRLRKEGRDPHLVPWDVQAHPDEMSPSPEAQHEFVENVSIAFLTVLDNLGADERTVFLLHDVFDFGYAEIAEIVGKSEAACRQIIHRARPRIKGARPRLSVTVASRERLLQKFLHAAESGDREAVMKLLSERTECRTASDAKVSAAGNRHAAVAHEDGECEGHRSPTAAPSRAHRQRRTAESSAPHGQ